MLADVLNAAGLTILFLVLYAGAPCQGGTFSIEAPVTLKLF